MCYIPGTGLSASLPKKRLNEAQAVLTFGFDPMSFESRRRDNHRLRVPHTSRFCLCGRLFRRETTQPSAANHNEDSREESMPAANGLPFERLILSKMICVACVFCAATAITSPAQILTTLYSFCSQLNCADGEYPLAALVQGTDGNFYGTTSEGGTDGAGTVFKITPSGTLTTLHSFDGTDGNQPLAGLVRANDGNLYGTTTYGGGSNCDQFGCGTVFRITPVGTFTVLYDFCTQLNCPDGEIPTGLVQATDGNFYGMTELGGTYGAGTVFKITPDGELTTLYSFPGAFPSAALVQGTDGNFYGTTPEGGANGDGMVFKITSGGVRTTLYSFCSLPNCADGAAPQSSLVQGTDGNFYGTASNGGTGSNCPGTYGGCGTVFSISKVGALTTIYNFCSQPGCADGREGNTLYPTGALVQASDGNFYGTTVLGGYNYCTPGGCGTVFNITPSGSLTTLHSFDITDGYSPYAGLIYARDGNFYGTTAFGGADQLGTVFKFQMAYTLTVSTSGDGTVTTTDGYINCPGTCTHTYLSNTQVTLNASPAQGWSFSGWTGACSGVGPCNVTMTQNLAVTAVFVEPGHGFQLTAIMPCRLVDTRQTGGPIQGGTSRDFTVPQLGSCDIPATAAAYSLNVTVVPPGPLGYLTIWPTGEAQPITSLLNSPDGRTKADAAIVPVGNNGAVSVYVSNTTNVILDIDGYFTAPGSGTYQFYPLTPCRIVDTRNGDGGMLQAGVERDYTIPPNCGVPSSATAYSFNVTVLPSAGGLDYLTVWPQGESRPVVSTLNDNTGTVVANAAIVLAGSNNATAFYAHSNSTNLLLDVNGYFAAPGTGGFSMYPAAPCRVLDTRQSGGSFMGEKTVNVEGSACAPPSNAAAYVFNATVVPPGSMPYLTLWPDGELRPVASTLNAYDGFITSNMAIVPTTNGSIDAYAAALTQLILDISGYFAP
jgi:uncharacterized repeat protein (TIGR03803 family)